MVLGTIDRARGILLAAQEMSGRLVSSEFHGEFFVMAPISHLRCPMQRAVELKCGRTTMSLGDGSHQHFSAGQIRQRLAEYTGITDQDLLDRLMQHGFRAETVEALTLLPVAMAAWASGSVTAEERRTAELAIADSDICTNVEAIEKYRSWLQRRPAPELWQLWHDFTVSRVGVLGSTWFANRGRSVLASAKRVAAASGGMFGFGWVSPAEHQVLRRIEATHIS